MNWLRGCRHREVSSSEDPLLRDAETRLASIKERAEHVHVSLFARDKRNHWGETVSEIARGRREGRA